MLIIDTPSSCSKCSYCREDFSGYAMYNICNPSICVLANNRDIDYYDETNTKPDWCPLSPLPEKINLKQYVDNCAADINSVVAYAYAQGYNDCLDEIIEGEK